jgi:hypothetical protein
MSKFRIGDIVRLNKGVMNFKKGQYVRVVAAYENHFRAEFLDGHDYWYVNYDEAELATKGGEMTQPYQRKTYRLLRELPGISKYTLFQEMCEDGTQPYRPLEDVPGLDYQLSSRELVENNPKWFEEVFLVMPQYQTREELDQWEAFKGRKKPGRKAKPIFSQELIDDVMGKPARRRRWTPAQRKAQSQRMARYHAMKKRNLI